MQKDITYIVWAYDATGRPVYLRQWKIAGDLWSQLSWARQFSLSGRFSKENLKILYTHKFHQSKIIDGQDFWPKEYIYTRNDEPEISILEVHSS